MRIAPRSTLSPYTTLFRSCLSWRPTAGPLASSLARRTGPSPGSQRPDDRRSGCRRTDDRLGADSLVMARFCARSEEHTSELQSRFDLVCRLLLEKKKTTAK